MALSETMLDSSISSEDIYIEGFSREVYRNDHPSNSKVGGVCIYFRDGLAIKQRRDLELMQETIVWEVNISRKKIFSSQFIEVQVKIVNNLKISLVICR